MVDDPKKSPDSEEEKDEAEKDEKKDEAEEKAKPAAASKESDESDEEEDDEDEDEEEEEEKPAPKKVEAKKEPAKKEAPKAAKKAEEPKPKPKPTGPIIIGPKESPAPHKEAVVRKRTALLLAEYPTPGKLLHAAEKLRDAGYKNFDTHSPFPVHGMDAAMGLPDSKLGWIVFAGGLTGVTTAVTMIWWMNGVDYPIIIGGKPGFALPSSVPIMFELTVLFSAFCAVFGMLGLNKLPRHNHPIFESERFNAATDDKFFVSVEAEDPKFDLKKTRTLLESTHADAVEVVEEELEPEPVHEEEH